MNVTFERLIQELRDFNSTYTGSEETVLIIRDTKWNVGADNGLWAWINPDNNLMYGVMHTGETDGPTHIPIFEVIKPKMEMRINVSEIFDKWEFVYGILKY